MFRIRVFLVVVMLAISSSANAIGGEIRVEPELGETLEQIAAGFCPTLNLIGRVVEIDHRANRPIRGDGLGHCGM